MTVFRKVVLREIGNLKCMHAHVTPVQTYGATRIFFTVLVHPRSPLCSGAAQCHATEETRNRGSFVLTRDVLERHACHSGSGHDVSERHACSKRLREHV